jgi:deoxyadenosine/deoxycytidine kinase
MLSDGSVFTEENLDEYLKEVAKEYKKWVEKQCQPKLF